MQQTNLGVAGWGNFANNSKIKIALLCILIVLTCSCRDESNSSEKALSLNPPVSTTVQDKQDAVSSKSLSTMSNIRISQWKSTGIDERSIENRRQDIEMCKRNMFGAVAGYLTYVEPGEDKLSPEEMKSYLLETYNLTVDVSMESDGSATISDSTLSWSTPRDRNIWFLLSVESSNEELRRSLSYKQLLHIKLLGLYSEMKLHQFLIDNNGMIPDDHKLVFGNDELFENTYLLNSAEEFYIFSVFTFDDSVSKQPDNSEQ